MNHTLRNRTNLVAMKSRFILYVILFAAVFLKALAFAAEKPASDPQLIFSAVVHGTAIKIYIATQPFDPSLYRTTPYTSKEDGSDWHHATIDGQEVIGTDGLLPKAGRSQLKSLYVMFGKKRVDLDPRLRNCVFNPCMATASFNQRYGGNIVSVSEDGQAVLISLGVGDTGASTTHTFYIGADGTTSDREPDRPNPG